MEIVPESIKKLLEIQEKVNRGEMKLTSEQENKMNKLIEAYQLSVQSSKQLTKIKACVLYERLVYLGKLQVLEQIGINNKNFTAHPCLEQMKPILYEENQFFEISGHG